MDLKGRPFYRTFLSKLVKSVKGADLDNNLISSYHCVTTSSSMQMISTRFALLLSWTISLLISDRRSEKFKSSFIDSFLFSSDAK